MRKIYLSYINSFAGLSREVWWLSLITLINRAGTMVIPFLSLYLTQSLNFSLKDVGWIMTAFGCGSLLGSWIGGKITDKIGYYKVMVASLLLSGIAFVFLQLMDSFWTISLGIFVTMALADMFRPAVFVALSAYSKPENKTRSVTLIRLAINLGFSMGPALGGLIITRLGYAGLFWVDGVTCFLAGLLLLQILNPKKARVLDEVKADSTRKAYKDQPYLLFLVTMVLFGFMFMQYFSSVPVFYKEAHALSEYQIGLLLGLNGFLIFIFEMPLIKYFESKPWSVLTNLIIGCALTLLSFLILNMGSWIGLLLIGIILMTFGEMLTFPFSNAFALNRAKGGNQGEYMALYSIAFSIAHIFGHNSGMHLVEGLGFTTSWNIIAALGLLGCLLLFLLKKMLRR
ncbi:MFS transporter [Robertkochia solimangrovi]|uniref:MFS transporter n=1 Tax=Robertkochia solimangrovi TaxID=2213046 RepID=UPI00117D805A|nr:MFS transporter [Robertkochia solimangrovi]TRZ43734.1 MFS transporter [Robertkochia solimangrovi]